MASSRRRTPQQRDARELALTRPADPYRGALTDPYLDQPEPGLPEFPVEVPPLPRVGSDTPGSATAAGVLGITLALVLALFGVSLLAVLSLQHDYGTADRSFYRGTDSGYVVLALLDFGLAIGSGAGGIALMNGRLGGRLALTATGWTTLMLSAFWYLRGQVTVFIPLVIAAAATIILTCAYQAKVTRWLGVLPVPQPD